MGRSKGGGKSGKAPAAVSASSDNGRGFIAPPAVVGSLLGDAFRPSRKRGIEVESVGPDAIWERTGLGEALVPILGPSGDSSPAGLNPALRVYRYAVGEVFGAHYDESTDVAAGGHTEFTFLLYLTGGVVGGETAFYRHALLARDDAKETFRVAPELGKALVFRHGARCPPHASLAVERGTKLVLRSDVVYERRRG